jgi:hypothetical protein
MAITKKFTPLKKPAQFVYAGEKHLEVWSLAKGKYKSTRVLENSNIFNMSNQDFANVKPGLPGGNVSVGLVLNSANFIFNVFEFEKIPLLEERQKDLVEWRVQKVFPEKIELYDHQFFQISKNKVLSVLFKKELLERVEKLFKDNGLELIFVGNSTLQILNYYWGSLLPTRSKAAPDFVVEVDGTLTTIVFQDKSVPYYFRKFRCDKDKDLQDEVDRTLNFVKTTYSKQPKTFSIIANHPQPGLELFKTNMLEAEIRQIGGKTQKPIFLPGIR